MLRFNRSGWTIGAHTVRFLAAALLLFSTTAQALDPSYLSHWPSADRVLADHAGVDEDDTLARQMSALIVMQNSIDYMAGPRRWQGLTPDEQRLRGEYYRAADRIRGQVHATHSNERTSRFGEAPLQKWNGQQWRYEGDPSFRHTTLTRYLPAEAVTRIEAETPGILAPPKGGEGNGLIGWLPWVAGLAVFLLLLRAWRRLAARRRERSLAAAAAADPTVPSEYAELSDADRELLGRAGREVLDSLEPFILAAQLDGRPLPTAVLLDNDVLGYLLQYDREALQLEGASDADIQRLLPLVLFHQRVVAPERISRLFGGDGRRQNAAARRPDPAVEHPLRAGMVRAIHALYAFKETTAHPLSSLLDEDEPAIELALAAQPPATRLHPRGPNAPQAQQLVLHYLSARLVTAAAAL